MKEIYKIKKFLNDKNKNELIAIWDLKSSGVAIGDFIIFLFFLKYFQMKGKIINLYIVYKKKEIREFQEKISDNHIKNYWLDLKFKTAKKVLNIKYLKLRLTDWENLNKKKLNNKKTFLIFKAHSLKRKRYLDYVWFIQNYLLKKEKKNFIENYLISSENFKNDASQKIKNFCRYPFFCLIIRKEKSKNDRRILTSEDIISFINKIYKIKKKGNLLIVSDDYGNNFVRKVLKKNKKLITKNIKIFFNKDISKDIFQDAFLLLKSRCSFSIPASGGIMCWLHYSKVPFLLSFYHSRIMNLRFSLSNKYLHFFWKKNQVWVNSNNAKDLLKKMDRYKF